MSMVWKSTVIALMLGLTLLSGISGAAPRHPDYGSPEPYTVWSSSWGWHGDWETTVQYYRGAWEQDMALRRLEWDPKYGAGSFEHMVASARIQFDEHMLNEKIRLEGFFALHGNPSTPDGAANTIIPPAPRYIYTPPPRHWVEPRVHFYVPLYSHHRPYHGPRWHGRPRHR